MKGGKTQPGCVLNTAHPMNATVFFQGFSEASDIQGKDSVALSHVLLYSFYIFSSAFEREDQYIPSLKITGKHLQSNKL